MKSSNHIDKEQNFKTRLQGQVGNQKASVVATPFKRKKRHATYSDVICVVFFALYCLVCQPLSLIYLIYSKPRFKVFLWWVHIVINAKGTKKSRNPHISSHCDSCLVASNIAQKFVINIWTMKLCGFVVLFVCVCAQNIDDEKWKQHWIVVEHSTHIVFF